MYEDFATIYDTLQQDIDYEAIADYIDEAFARFGTKPSLVLDLACGTGNITVPLSVRGYEMIGVDLSVQMLNSARIKAETHNQDILFLNQDITDFELYGTVDAMVCVLDSVNYITDKRALKRFFKLCYNYLNPNGLLIFDINTLYKFKEILGNNIFINDAQDIYYIWRNNFDAKSRLCEFDLTFFCKNETLYSRFDELHTERAYSIEEISSILQSTDMTVIGCFDEYTFNKLKDKSERVVFVAKK